MKILISILLIFLILILTLRLKINIKNIERNKNIPKIKYKIQIGIYLFGFIKVLWISFTEKGIKIFNFEIPYQKMKLKQMDKKCYRELVKIDNLKKLDLKVEKMYLKVNLGFDDIMLTVLLVAGLSSILSILGFINKRQINLKKYKYEVNPIYNCNIFEIKSEATFSAKIINIIFFLKLIKNNQYSKSHTKFNLLKI